MAYRWECEGCGRYGQFDDSTRLDSIINVAETAHENLEAIDGKVVCLGRKLTITAPSEWPAAASERIQ